MRFAALTWLVTRACILAAFAFSSARGVVAALGNWDGAWYGSIVQHGYEFVRDAHPHNVAFFPGFPLAADALFRAGVSWPLAGALVNNAAFLFALFFVSSLVSRRFDRVTARWCVVLLCVLPLSLFCAVAYSEGLFLLFSSLALWSYDRERFLLCGVAAACACATRPLGIALAVALAVAVIVTRRRKSDIAYCSIGLAGIVAYAAYCAARFGDALAFVHAQPAWRHGVGFDAAAWWGLVRGAAGGRVEDVVALVLLAVGAIGIARYRTFGLEHALFIAVAIALFAAAGAPISLDRNLYAVVPVSIAGAYLCRRAPVLGAVACAAMLVALVVDASAFARFEWVA